MNRIVTLIFRFETPGGNPAVKTHLSALFTIIPLALLAASCSYFPIAAVTPGPDLAATNRALKEAVNKLAAESTIQAAAEIAKKTVDAIPEFTQTPYVITATTQATAGETVTPAPTEPPAAEDTATPAPVDPAQQIKERVRAANILVYDNPDEKLRLVPRLNKAIAASNFSGGNVVYTGNYLGNFDRLLRSQNWDLVVLAVESRDTVDLGKLGLLDPINQHLARGGALIVETWNLDEDPSALAGLALNVCNAHIEKDWHRGNETDDANGDSESDAAGGYAFADFIIYPSQSAGDIFTTPEKVNLPLRPTIFWEGDAGDLIRIDPGGDSISLAGLPSQDPNNYSLLTSCLGGRMILQTFSTHDYPVTETLRLWENMMNYTLTNAFLQQQ